MIESKEKVQDCPNRKPLFSEEQLGAIIKEMDAITESTKELNDSLKSITSMVVQSILSARLDRCQKYAKKYIESSFITRGYWFRKVKKEFDQITKLVDEVGDLLNDSDLDNLLK